MHAKTKANAAREKTDRSGVVRVRGAREHNLKNVDVDVPRDALVAFSGISGSGKSSLAFGTIYAESQRRYLESVAPYARRLIDQAGTPAVDSIDGLPPAVALQQQRGTPGARSSVGSVTTIASLLRLMYSRAGTYPRGQPMLYAEDFSPNTVQGACPTCHGLGSVYEVTEKTMVPDDSLSIRERAIAAWPPAWHGQNLRDILVTLGYDVDKPWRELPRKDRDWILYTEEHPTVPVYAGFTPAETRAALRRKMEPSYMGTFTGARQYVLHTFATTQSALMKKRVARYMVGAPCPACAGKRLKAEALSVTFAGLDIGALSQLSLAALAEVLEPAARGEFPDAPRKGGRADPAARSRRADHAGSSDVRRTANLSEEKRIAAQRLSAEMLARLQALLRLGLGHLTLDRSAPTLSPGELQRLRLGTQLHSSLFGVVYVLDEPSAGLHPVDAGALYDALDALKEAGNSVFVVEHDMELLRRADWIVDVGPGAGERGGEVIYSGEPAGLAGVAASCTARHLFPRATDAAPARAPRAARGWLRLEGVKRNNLHGLDVALPLGVFTTVTGVSGSGKSSLVTEALVDLVSAELGHEPALEDDEADEGQPRVRLATAGRIASGMAGVRRVVRVDQKPIGRTPRSNLATYTGLFDAVRELFAGTRAARSHRFGAGHFSFNVAKGRCEVCDGEGVVSVEMHFMPSVYAPCPRCRGRRYREEILQVKWAGLDIAQVLAQTVDEAAAFFAAQPAIARPLAVMQRIGLGYLRLGQSATQLSGGEAQRIKLATELQRAHRGGTLYVLDEPTTGLHPQDVDLLMAQLHVLVEAGNTVVAVEHEMHVAAASDWVIDMGPGAGDAGGRVVAQGLPREVAAAKGSRTAPFLAACLAEGR